MRRRLALSQTEIMEGHPFCPIISVIYLQQVLPCGTSPTPRPTGRDVGYNFRDIFSGHFEALTGWFFPNPHLPFGTMGLSMRSLGLGFRTRIFNRIFNGTLSLYLLYPVELGIALV